MHEVTQILGMISKAAGFGVLWESFLHGLPAIPIPYFLLWWFFIALRIVAIVFLQVVPALFIARLAWAWNSPISGFIRLGIADDSGHESPQVFGHFLYAL